MFMTKIVLLFYGILLTCGAYFGFKAGSTVSLIMGIISGAVVFLGLYLTGQNPVLGFSVLSVVSGLLSVVFTIRLIKTHQFMPAGMLLLMSVIALTFSIIQLIQSQANA